jgi:hypothetical protein
MSAAMANPPGISRNIHELVDFLRSTHQDGDLYRGQNRDFPVMVPSFFRPFVRDLATSSPIAEIDEARFQEKWKTDLRASLKFDVMNHLIGDFGVGLGNIIAQQYGVSSEALDVTDDIRVAAYFATRRYPEYNHISDAGVGVIYRFRDLKSDGLPRSYRLSDLSGHFESGMSSTGYYDFFVRTDEMEKVFDRDRWWGFQKGSEGEAWTPRFVSDWPSLQEAVAAGGQELPLGKGVYLGPYPRTFSWKLTRFFSQSGGLIRPRLHWKADTPSRFELARDANQAQEIRMRGMIGPRFRLQDRDGEGKWPLVIPSAAIKREILGVENLRASSACEAYFFEHSEHRVTGFYRRELWPEPAEDPLYGALWQLAMAKLQRAYGWGAMPAIDDPEMGILDRGYTLAGEVRTRDARDDNDLRRGQLEDAIENRTHGAPRAVDYLYQVTPLLFLDDTLGAMRASVAGLRLEPENVDLLLGLSEGFSRRKKPSWEAQTVERALLYAPSHPWLLYKKAMHLARRGDFSQATTLIEKAIELYDPVTCKYTDYFFLELRGVLAWVMGETETLREVIDTMTSKDFSATEIMPQVQWLLKQFPELEKTAHAPWE